MNRPRIGTNPTLTYRDSESYLDFVQGLFMYMRKIDPAATARAEREMEATGVQPANVQEAHQMLGKLPIMATRHRFRRTIQEMKRDGVEEDLAHQEAELLAALDRADTMGPGSVQWDPNFPIPEYATKEIHLMPGGYVKYPLAGYWYHYGTKIFYSGTNDNDEMHQALINRMPIPADGQVRRVLDLGCSSGQSATALKRRFPQAEVWGVDIGAPMVRYSHKRAVDMGLDVHFKQALAEDTGFPSGSFDIVHAYILYHEVPVEIGEAIAREAHRLLRPGGVYVVTDFKTKGIPRNFETEMNGRRATGIVGQIYGDIDGRHNNEPYAHGFTQSDFEGYLTKLFGKLDLDLGFGIPTRIATKM